MSDKLNQALSNLSESIKKISNDSRSLKYGEDFLEFSVQGNASNARRGLKWIGDGETKEFIYKGNDKFYSSESIELEKSKSIIIDNNPVLGLRELGPTVTKSNLTKLGTLEGLRVNGNVILNDYLFYNSNLNRLGFGTDRPTAALSIAEQGIEIGIGTSETGRGKIGTYGSHGFEIVTDNTTRISIDANGNLEFGSKNLNSINVTVNGKLKIDQSIEFNGSMRFQNRLHRYDDAPPNLGDYNRGDIIWNSEPDLGKPIGWVCVRAGTPGKWLPFGDIKGK